jgi:hypothetical protein
MQQGPCQPSSRVWISSGKWQTRYLVRKTGWRVSRRLRRSVKQCSRGSKTTDMFNTPDSEQCIMTKRVWLAYASSSPLSPILLLLAPPSAASQPWVQDHPCITRLRLLQGPPAGFRGRIPHWQDHELLGVKRYFGQNWCVSSPGTRLAGASMRDGLELLR